ncbi:MAG TPA: hypothetical protein VK120_07400 [Sporosarcina sp.]|nr:hypothetical protein [Sporosarcina sp.]
MQKDFIFTTSIVCALFIVLMLQFLSFFHFIDWQPTHLLTSIAGQITEQPIILFIILLLLFFIYFLCLIFLLLQLSYFPPFLISIMLTVITFYIMEWMISQKVTIAAIAQSEAIPLIALLAIVFRLIAGTTSFYKEQFKSD